MQLGACIIFFTWYFSTHTTHRNLTTLPPFDDFLGCDWESPPAIAAFGEPGKNPEYPSLGEVFRVASCPKSAPWDGAISTDLCNTSLCLIARSRGS